MIDKDKLEKLLLKNWTEFVDFKKLLAFLLQTVRDSEFPTTKKSLDKKNQIKLSRFTPIEDGFIIWCDFSILKNNNVVIGTTELFYNFSEIKHIQTIGHITE